MKILNKKIFILMFLNLTTALSLWLFVQNTAWAAPQTITLYGQILKPDNTPLENESVQFTVTVLSPGTETCTLYEETHTVNMTESGGQFSFKLGDGTLTQKDPGIGISQVFNNSTSRNSLTCKSGTTYTPTTETDKRKIVLSFKDGSETVIFNSPYVVSSVPYAFEAERLGGKTANQFIQTLDNNSSQSRFNRVFNTDYSVLDALLAGTSSLYVHPSGAGFAPTGSMSFNSQKITDLQDPAAAQDAATKNYVDTTVGSKTVDLTGLANGNVLVWNSGQNKWEAATPSFGSSDSTKLPLAGGTMTGALNMGSNNITASGYITMSGNKYLQLGNFTAAEETTLLNSISASVSPTPASFAGTTWFNTTSHKWRLWNGSAAETLTTNEAADITGGSISGVSLSSSDLTVDTNTLVVDSTNNRVGLGTATPVTALDINGAVTARGLAEPTSAKATGRGVIYYDSTANKFKVSENNGSFTDLVGGGGSGSVTSVGLSLPSIFSVSNSPVTSSGTLTATLATQTAATVLAGPTSGAAAAPAFRALASTDLPSAAGDVSGSYNALSVDKIKGTAVTTNTPTNGKVLRYDSGQSKYDPSYIRLSDIISTIDGTSQVFPTNCAANQTLTWSSGTGVMSCTNIAFPSSTAANSFLASPDGSTGTPTFRTIASGDLPTVPVTKGGTGATTQAGAANAVLPSQTSNSGKFLTTDGSNVSWETLSSSQWSTSGSDIYYSTGKVGIGSSTPIWQIQINTDNLSNASNGLTINTFENSTGYTGGLIRFSSARGTSAAPTATLSNDVLGGLSFTGYWSGKSSPYFNINEARASIQSNASENWTDSSHNGSYLIFNTTANATSTLTERMRIDQNGKVGIATTTPAYKMHVVSNFGVGTAGTSGTDQVNTDYITKAGNSAGLSSASAKGWSIYARGDAFSTAAEQNDLGISYWNGSTWTPSMVLDSANNRIGIGTTLPLYDIHLERSASQPAIYIKNSTSGVDAFIGTSSTNVAQIGSVTSGLRILTNNSEQVRIDTSGNFGLGTTSPTSKMTVSLNTATLPAPTYTGVAHFGGADGSQARIWLDSFGTNMPSIFFLEPPAVLPLHPPRYKLAINSVPLVFMDAAAQVIRPA